MIANNAFCLFPQEGRSKSSGIFLFEGVIVCRSQGLQGQYGCEVWVNPNVVVASCFDRKYKAVKENLSILSAKPRSIVVSLSLGPISCSLVSLHAPHASSPQFTSWWDDFSDVWDIATDHCKHVWCGADLNYAFGRHDVHPCLGGGGRNVGKTLRHPISSRVMSEVSACGCKVVSSFEEFCRQEYVASPYTYCTKDESSYSCIDHFLVAGNVSTSSRSINHIFPLLLVTFNDHYPIMGFFTIPPSYVDKGLGSHRSIPYDVERVGEPLCDAVFLGALSAARAVPLILEPTSHCRLLEEIVVGAACDAYPFKKDRKKQEWVSDISLKFMNDRDQVLREFQKRKKSLHNASLFAVFKFWARGYSLKYSIIRGFYTRSYLINYYRAYAKLWYHNRHASAYVEMDKLNMLDNKSQEIEKILADAVDITSIHRHIKSL